MASKPAQTEPEWIVLVEPAHGGLIHGARRKKGDVFAAPEAAMLYLALEGVVAPKPATAAAPARAPKAEPGA